jgi:hypothetical protein
VFCAVTAAAAAAAPLAVRTPAAIVFCVVPAAAAAAPLAVRCHLASAADTLAPIVSANQEFSNYIGKVSWALLCEVAEQHICQVVCRLCTCFGVH